MRQMVLFIILLLSAASFSHIEGTEEGPSGTVWARLGIPEPLNVLYLVSLVSGFSLFYAVFVKNTSEQTKKIVYFFIAAPIVIGTIYLAASTVYMNLTSETGGPVHWHADYEIWACGIQYSLGDPMGMENRVGSSAIHEHNDNRIHVEGVLLNKSEASLRNFFVQVGGNFDEDSLTLPTSEGVYTWNNRDKCNGKSAKWYVFVNDELNEDPHDYVISPWSNVPPGDRIKFVFTEKNLSQINTTLGGPP